jgi:hypothetical protein
MLKKVSLTSPNAATNAEVHANSIGAAEETAEAMTDRCMMQFVQNAEQQRKSRSSQAATSRYIVTIVSVQRRAVIKM